MKYIIIENGDNITLPQILMNEKGEAIIYSELDEAIKEASNCHYGIVVPLHKGLIDIIKDAHNVIGMAKFELGEDFDEGEDDSIEGSLGLLLGY